MAAAALGVALISSERQRGLGGGEAAVRAAENGMGDDKGLSGGISSHTSTTVLPGDESPCIAPTAVASPSALGADSTPVKGFTGLGFLTLASSSVVVAGIELGLYNFGGTALQVS